MADTVSFEGIPLRALRWKSRIKLARFLDPIKILPTFDGLFRDWRGIVHLTRLTCECESYISSKPNPTNELMNILEQEQPSVTLALFVKMLADIDRWDVIDDTHDMFVSDAEEFTKNYDKCSVEPQPEGAITIDDVKSAQQNLPFRRYHALVLYSDSDIKFAKDIIENVENCDLKLCLKDRDFLPGLNFEHDAVRKLLTERCDRLIVILSPDFVMSPLNAFITNIAESLGIAEQKRKIIPCIYKSCVKPAVFEYIHPLSYEGFETFGNFWEKLKMSLQNVPGDKGPIQNLATNADSSIPENSLKSNDTKLESLLEHMLDPMLKLTPIPEPDQKVKRKKRAWHRLLFVN